MSTFETSAVLDDASHLTLRNPLPIPAGQECRVVIHFAEVDKSSPEWIAEFLEKIRIDDPAFVRPPQGELPPARSLNGDDPA